jgi:hypothetical protein
MQNILSQSIDFVKNMINQYEFLLNARKHPQNFSRIRNMGFLDILIMILKSAKHGIQAGIYEYLDEAGKENMHYSKQAFCKSRKNIRYEAIEELFTNTVDNFYNTCEYETYKGYRLCAIDGICYNLPNNGILKAIYGGPEQKDHYIPQVQAQGSCLYDVLNGIVIDAKFKPYKTSERDLADQHLSRLFKIKTEKELVIMDRGYPSRELIDDFNDKGIYFIMRTNKENFISVIRGVESPDSIVTDVYKRKETDLRLINIVLDNGSPETLLTNVFDPGFSVSDFKELYHLRWNIETKYNDIKGKLEIENFTGTSELVLLQDFYATMFMTNIVGFGLLDANNELKRSGKKQKRKHEHKVNVRMAIYELRNEFINLYTINSPRKRGKIFKKIMNRLIENTVPFRPRKPFPRKRKYPSLKFPMSRKSV